MTWNKEPGQVGKGTVITQRFWDLSAACFGFVTYNITSSSIPIIGAAWSLAAMLRDAFLHADIQETAREQKRNPIIMRHRHRRGTGRRHR